MDERCDARSQRHRRRQSSPQDLFIDDATRLTPEDNASLEALNRRLAAWIEGEYHHTPHRGLDGQTPLERWAQTAEQVRFPEPTLDLDDLFLFEAKRKVQKDRTVSLDGVVYEVDAALVGERVTLRFDPAVVPGHSVQVYRGRAVRAVQTRRSVCQLLRQTRPPLAHPHL